MSEFTASNGVTIKKAADGSARWKSGGAYVDTSLAIRELFLHERDEELGRWRWPENPGYVVYPTDGGFGALVINEHDGLSAWFRRDGNHFKSLEHEAARAYFEAHPERKPWHDAQDGEAWLIECSGTPEGGEPFIVHLGKFKSPTTISLISRNDPTITAGHRIWPRS